jgi:hypothetical protein
MILSGAAAQHGGAPVELAQPVRRHPERDLLGIGFDRSIRYPADRRLEVANACNRDRPGSGRSQRPKRWRLRKIPVFGCNARKRFAFSSWMDVIPGLLVKALASKEYG